MAALRLGLSLYIRCISSQKLKSTVPQLVYKAGGLRLLSTHHDVDANRLVGGQNTTIESPSVVTKFEESQDPEEWKYVERLLPFVYIPEPTPKKEYPSGWKPQSEEVLKLPYYVARTKNHMLPVYINIKHRGLGRVTKIRRVKGDIWKLADQLKQYVETETGRNVAFQVNEMNGIIKIKGDYAVYCEEWLSNKGF